MQGEVPVPAGGDNAVALLRQGEVLVDLRRHGEAVPILQRSIALEPGRARAWCLLALALHGDGRDAEALEAADRAAAVDPLNEWAHRLRALTLGALGRKDDAFAAANEAVRVAPAEPKAHQMLASVALDNSMMSTARAAVTRCVQLAPDQAYPWGLLGRLRLKEDVPAQAEEALMRGLSIDPTDAVMLNNLGVAQLRQGKWKPALSSFAESARTDPTLELPVSNIERIMRSHPRGGLSTRPLRFVAIPTVGPMIALVVLSIYISRRSIRWAALRREMKRTMPAHAIRHLDLRVRAAVPLWPPLVGILVGAILLGVAAGQLASAPGTDQSATGTLLVLGGLLSVFNTVLLVRRITARRLRRGMAR